MTTQMAPAATNHLSAEMQNRFYALILNQRQESRHQPRPYVQPALVQPDLVANIEAAARGEDPPDEYESPTAANYAKLGMPYGGDPSVDNMHRLSNPPPMFDAPDAPSVLAASQPAYVSPSFVDLVVNEAAQRRRGNGKAAAAAPAPGEQEAYIPESMW